MINNKSELINMFFMKELSKLIDKYNGLSEEIINRIEEPMFEDEENKKYYYAPIDKYSFYIG